MQAGPGHAAGGCRAAGEPERWHRRRRGLGGGGPRGLYAAGLIFGEFITRFALHCRDATKIDAVIMIDPHTRKDMDHNRDEIIHAGQ